MVLMKRMFKRNNKKINSKDRGVQLPEDRTISITAHSKDDINVSDDSEWDTEIFYSARSIMSEDELLILDAEQFYSQDSVSLAARLLRQVQDYALLTSEHKEILRLGTMLEATRSEMVGSPDQAGWKRQGEGNDPKHAYSVYYKISDSGICSIRIDALLQRSLAVPFFAVFNEPELQKTWIPSWKIPFKVGISKTEKLSHTGRVNQVVQMQNDFGPLSKRETILQIVADDDTTADDSATSSVTLKLMGLMEPSDVVPEFDKKVVRMDLDGGLLFQACPPDHPLLQKKQQQQQQQQQHNTAKSQSSGKISSSTGQHLETPKDDDVTDAPSDCDEPQILLTYTMNIDPKVTLVPNAFLNFCTRTVVGGIFRKMLHVAEEARDGIRPDFVQVIKDKQDTVYRWMQERIDILLEQGSNSNNNNNNKGVVTAVNFLGLEKEGH